MERLTVPDDLIEGGKRRAIIDARAVRAVAMTIYWALKKYEDTGLTPEEIVALNTFDGIQAAKATEKLQEEQRKHRWIPVSERLPEVGKEVLVQWEKYDISTRNTCIYIDKMWRGKGGETVFETYLGSPNGKVVAWMPLPEPYREVNHDKE